MNQVTVFNPAANLPAFFKKGELSAVATALAGSAGAGKRISVKGGTFRLVINGKEVTRIEERYLDVVIVAAASKITRTFYATTFDENNPTAPDCWSADGDTPDPKASNKQAPSCATCPQNVKGSGQGDSKACRYSQRVAVVLANDMEGDVLQLSLAATSIFGKEEGENRPLQAYARYLVAQGIDPSMLVTRMKFDTNAATPKLFFKPMRWLTDDEYALCKEQGASADALQAITMTVAEMDKAPAPVNVPGQRPAAAAPAAAPAPAPAPAADDEPPPPAPKPRKTRAAAPAPAPAPVAEEPDEPEVRKAPVKASAPAQTSLAAALSDWDTDD